MHGALVKANLQDDEVQVTMKVVQQGKLALPSKE